MTNSMHRIVFRLLPVAFAILLAGCGGNADSKSGPAHIRLLNLSIGYESVDLYTNNQDSDADTQQFAAVARSSISDYASLKADSYTLKFRKSGVSGNLQLTNTTLATGSYATYVTYGATNRFSALAINDDTDEPSTGYTKVVVLNAASGGSFDVYLTGANDSINDVSAAVGSVASTAGTVATVSSGSYRLRVLLAGSKTDLRLDVPSVALQSGGVLSIILVDAAGGQLVNAALLPQRGQPTIYDNSESAQLRLLNLSSGYDSLDLYSSTDSDDTDTQRFAAVTRDSASAYASLKADSYVLKFRKTGVTGNLLALGATLAENSHVTYVAYGATSHFALMPVYEDTEAAAAGYTKVQILNTTASDSLDIYLTGPNDALTDVSATMSAVAAGTQGSITTIASGQYRLRITGTGSKSDVRLDVPAIDLASGGVASIVLSETSGGVLVNAVLLPQQGDPVVFDNGTVRIRGAVGLSAGSAVTVNVAGTDILTRRPARSFIADTYTTLPAASVPINVYVDNVLVGTATRTLQSGGDYTLLVWDASGAPQITLVPDDNHAAQSGKAKLRLLNGMSGLGEPLNLSIDYSPIAEYVDVGTASSAAEIAASSDYQLDVTNAQTLVALLTRDSVTLQDRGVYTFLAAGGGTSGIAGTLRKDR